MSSFTLLITISPAVDIWLYLGNIIQKYTAEKQKEERGDQMLQRFHVRFEPTLLWLGGMFLGPECDADAQVLK